MVRPPREELLLDVGCGTGAASRAASAATRLVIGVDLSAEMIRRAAELASGVENVRFLITDSEQLPFDDGAFTAVPCSNWFYHYPAPPRAVREMARVLARDGRLVIGDACTDLPTRAHRRCRPPPDRTRSRPSLPLQRAGSFLQRAGLSRVMFRKLSGGGFAIVRGIAA
jgi:ubiquinone/menaquinone biosynthesis C-methylase UbiE